MQARAPFVSAYEIGKGQSEIDDKAKPGARPQKRKGEDTPVEPEYECDTPPALSVHSLFLPRQVSMDVDLRVRVKLSWSSTSCPVSPR